MIPYQRSLGHRFLRRILVLLPLLLLSITAFAQPSGSPEKQALDPQSLAQLLTDEKGQPPKGEGFQYVDAHLEPARARINYLVHNKVPLEIVLVNKSSGERAYTETASFKLYYAAAPEMDDATQETFMKALDEVITRVKNNDEGSWYIPHKGPEFGGKERGVGHQASTSSKESEEPLSFHLFFGFLLFFGALLWLPSALKYSWQSFRSHEGKHQIGLVGLVSIGAFIRWVVVPHLVVTMYMGFKLADRAAYLQEHFRYGVGAQVMWHGLFEITGPDHAYLIGLNSLLAVFSLIWFMTVLTRAGFRPSGVLLAIGLLALIPMNIWSDASDSLTVPVMFWTLGATLFAQRVLDHGKIWDLWGALLWLGMAAHTRPEHMLFGPLFVVTILAFQSGSESIKERLKMRKGLWLLAGLGYLTVCLPQILHALQMREWMIQTDGWPHKWWEIIPDLPSLLSERNALLDPDIAPPMLLPLAFLGLIVARNKEARRFRIALFALGLMWMSFYYIDLSIASLPRLHVVMLIPCLLIIADLLSDVWTWRSRVPWGGSALCILALASMGAGTPQNINWLWQETNEREEELFYREAAEALPETPLILVHSMEQDNEAGVYTHQHYPDYLLHEKSQTMSIGAFTSRAIMPGTPVYYYHGLRCYSRFRKEAEERPSTYILPGCAEVMDGYELEIVLEKTIKNHGDLALLYYSSEAEYRLGLYRVIKRK